MSRLFDSLYEKQKVRAQVASEGVKAAFDTYREQEAKKQRIEVLFDTADTEGNLSTTDENGIRLVLPMKEVKLTDVNYSVYTRKNYVGIRKLEVTIGEIDEENKCIYLKNGRVNENIIRALRGEMFHKIEEMKGKRGTDEYEPISIYGTIRSVSKNRDLAFVELLGIQGLVGTIHVSQWASSYTTIIPPEVEYENKPIEFHLIGTTRLNDMTYFNLSRRELYNPWEDIPDELFAHGTTLTVMCIHKPDDAGYWIGKVNGLPIDIRGNYTDRYDSTLVQPGRSFICTVKKGNKEKGRIYVVPFRYVMTEEERAKARENGKIFITKEDLDRLENEKRREIEATKNKAEAGETPDSEK